MLKSNGENCVVGMKKPLAMRRQAATVCIEFRVQESQSNAAVERDIGSWRGQLRVLKAQLTEHLKQHVATEHVMTAWMVIWAAEVISHVLVHEKSRSGN